MKKVFILYIVFFIIGAVAFFYGLNNFIYNEKQGEQAMENNAEENTNMSFKVIPVSHASMLLTMGGQTIYNDPVGAEGFHGHGEPDIILISDIHGDHLDKDTVRAVATERTTIIMPRAVADELPDTIPGIRVILNNGETTEQNGISIEAVPMYNVPESDSAPHTKGRGNGYILEANGERVYIAGDTGDIPEMRKLTDIDVAFVPMNLPYTMSVESAADAVIEFAPKKVHPYHYRGPDGLADIGKFRELVNAGNPDVTVEFLNFYPEE